MAVLWLTLSIFSVLTCVVAGREEAVGYELVGRETTINIGPVIFVFRGAVLQRGLVTAFHAHFKVTGDLKFQIWRPTRLDLSSNTFTLVAEKPVASIKPGNFTVRLSKSEQFHVEGGDRLGFLIEDRQTPIGASFLPVVRNPVFFHLLNGPVAPSVGEQVIFDALSYPYTFSIAVSYETEPELRTTESPKVGPIGATGRDGATGLPGATGPQGPVGAEGRPGLTGPPGPRGDPGLEGRQGPEGEKGDRGDPGRPGVTGPIGRVGATGMIGPQGQKGSMGVDATRIEATGRRGDTGATGDVGYPGLPGSVGATGPTGPRGRTGASGPPGRQGPEGVLGAVGATGLMGLKGDQGLQGDGGPRGQPGPGYSDVDECVGPAHGCDHGCVNEFGAYSCTCRKGYELRSDGRTCQDVDECKVRNGGCQISCTNSYGSYECSCGLNLMLSANGHTCQDIRECEVKNGGCRQDETCVDTWGGHICIYENAFVVGPKNSLKHEVFSQLVVDDPLLNPHIIIGLMAWLGVLTIILLTLLIWACRRKAREDRLRKKYIRYQELGGPIGLRKGSYRGFGSEKPF